MVFVEENIFRPSSITSKYPPYHSGEYLEEYFFRRWYEENIKADRIYIDIFWTNIFCNSFFGGEQYQDIQGKLNSFSNEEGYFTVCQLDDGPLERLPKDTLIFSAGGNREGDNIIPIPLICSPIPNNLIPAKDKTIFASFVGSNTHEIRIDTCELLSRYSDYSIISGAWSYDVPMDSFKKFIDITCSSKFGLAPRGYGKQSFRLYEIMQLGAVPVYISDEHYLPWKEEISWDDFCVLVSGDEVEEVDDILKSISDEKYNAMLKAGQKVYQEYFTLEGVFQNIVKRLLTANGAFDD